MRLTPRRPAACHPLSGKPLGRWRAAWPRLRRFQRSADGTPAIETPHRWLKPPDYLAGEDVCIFATYSPRGIMEDHTSAYIGELRRHGLKVIVVFVVDDLTKAPAETAYGGAEAVLLRANEGYDLAAWAAVLSLVPSLWSTRLLLLANDSVYGPFASFDRLMETIRADPADVVALTESFEVKRHFQSYFIALKAGALASSTMRAFWSGVRNLPSKWDTIRAYEVELLALCLRSRLACNILFPAKTRVNPALARWRELVGEGLPFVKVAALRDDDRTQDLRGWDAYLAAHGADVPAIVRHLREIAPDAPALRAYHRHAARSDYSGGGTDVPAGT